MSEAAEIGKNFLATSRIWRNSACFSRSVPVGYTRPQMLCNGDPTVSAPQTYAGADYHFRTPSPGGQQTQLRDLLPASFFVPAAHCVGRLCPEISVRRRNGAQLNPKSPDCLTRHSALPTLRASSKGIKKCVSGPLSSPSRHQLDWRLAVILRANRPSLAVPLARARRLSRAVVSLPVLQSVRLATSFSAKPIPAVVTKTSRPARPEFTYPQHRSAQRQCDVLRLHVRTREAPCSKSS